MFARSSCRRRAQRLLAGVPAAVSACLRRHISATVRAHDQLVLLQPDASDGAALPPEAMRFPAIWLRDNCRCDECYHADSQSRKPQRWQNFDTQVRVARLRFAAQPRLLQVEWTDGHRSSYALEWLRERDFAPAQRERYMRAWYRPAAQHWAKADFERILKRLQFADVMHSDEALLDWLHTLAVHGVCVLQNAPLQPDVVKRLAARVGFIRRTTYGEDFSVKSRPGAKNYSYLAAPLPLHTDLPYYEYKPSVTILHTLEQSQSLGGWNTLTDAYDVADRLRREQPQHFRVLAETPVDWSDIGADGGVSFHNIWRAPVINLDAAGQYARINHSVPQRDTHFSVDVERVRPWYEANALFVRWANEQAVSFKTSPGDVLSFNNLRMLHGRTGYDDTAANVRHIVGGFIDWDLVYSRMRVLKRTLSERQSGQQSDQQVRLRA